MTGPDSPGTGSLAALAATVPDFDANHLPLSAARAKTPRRVWMAASGWLSNRGTRSRYWP